MDNQQLKTLQNLLRTTEASPPQHRMEEMEMAAATNWGLYQQEGDKEGMAIYAPLLQLIRSSESVDQLLQKAGQLQTQA